LSRLDLLNNSLRSAKSKIKKVLNFYFILLIIEGALRRWILPEFSDIILIIRDPVAIYIIYLAWRSNLLVLNGYLIAFVSISLISFFTAVLVGHGNMWVALFGLRITLLHLPLVFIIAETFEWTDVLKIGRWIIYLTIPMTILIIIQFYSPQQSFINRGVGGNMDGAGFSGALGYFRPPGTFSFITGVSTFFGIAACFIFYALYDNMNLPKWLIFLALSAVLISTPFSISRTLFFSIALTFLFFIISIFNNRRLFSEILKYSIIVVLLMLLLSSVSILSTGIEVFSERFTSASETEGGLVNGTIVNRFLGGLIEAISTSDQRPFFGLGIGMGTNAGAKLLTGVSGTFLISEGEWGRLIGEMGPLIGIIFIFLRLIISINLSLESFKKIKTGNILPWILLSFVFVSFAQGQWAQPNTLGFSVFFTGMLMASLKRKERHG